MQVGAEKIVVLGTGGTIAGTAAQAGDNIGYVAAQVGVQQLLDAVPGLAALAGEGLQAEQVAQVDSKDMDFDILWRLASRCAEHLTDPAVRGLVITHGTDTIEETAWFLHSVLDARKPVVLTCAMRPASALVPDGPQNLLDAVAVVQAPGARGVVVVAAGSVHGAQALRKVHPYRVDAFDSAEQGAVGWVEEGTVRLAHDWPAAGPRDTGKLLSAGSGAGIAFPRVEIVMNHAGASGRMVDLLVADGIDGLVVAATGNGTMHHQLEAALVRAQAAGVAVRVTTRCALGRVLPKASDALTLDALGLSPVKARVALWLELWAARSESSAA
ncbi:MAG TPA: asparaginase [Brevundimonas sp.]|nr:asparaginase [Brevundimonas sp.]